ncbi:general secretion pathway protein F/type IV pilus assembly protein PilC [Orenia metallireducens]|uniref:General secretion pathway protein F/type IV pilus assembly protein PilC n=1 Tax=Orenia metallireducens TaxID=1413210 RepID=A0A285GI36_9FIRM|nr:type II secretion system F family protein [Orenia metallireducens]PRX30490.1 general secretion pathway protein F/type IV pilus assembly protein PilC [Orenia metallireducens]SNY22844.1 general secretion pathway protein F/type IV pilus assembly protein PilC [Orenia metallireducens]
MVKFSYKAINDKGQEVKGKMEALDSDDAKRRLAKDGLYLFELEELKEGLRSSNFSFNLAQKNEERILFTRQLANLLVAGVQLGESLQVIIELLKPGKFKSVAKEVYEALKGGRGFAESLAKYPSYFSKGYVSMVKAGEEGGFLDLTCQRLAQNLEDNHRFKSFIITSMIYPLVLLVVSILAVIVMLTFVLPKFLSIYENYRQKLPLSTEILLKVSDFLATYWLLVFVIPIVIILAIWSYYNTEAGRRKVDELLLQLPFIGEFMIKVEVARISRTLGTMLDSGVNLLKALDISLQVSSNIILQNTLQLAREKVQKGGALSENLSNNGYFPQVAVHMIGIGERTGKLSAMLLQLADNFEEESKASLEKMMKVFEPLVILVMGTVIGMMVVSMLLPMLNINSISF